MRMSLCAGAALAAGTCLSVSGDIVTYMFGLDGSQEVPPVATTGTGFAMVELDTISGHVMVSGTYTSMIGDVTAAHIHGPANVGANGPVIVHLTHTGGTAGTVTGMGVFSAGQVADMLAGLHYINVHSTFKPGGEIRGQVVPSPATLGLISLGGFAAARRRR